MDTISISVLSENAQRKAEAMAEAKENSGESTKVYARPYGNGHELNQINFISQHTSQYDYEEEQLSAAGWTLIDWTW